MSQEQSGFKVTDRRLFNPDGTPREGVNIEAEPPAEAPAAAQAEQPQSPPPARESAPQETAPAAGEEEQYDEDEELDPHDPASFVNFLMSLASNAAAALGMIEHPVTGQRSVDLAAGKQWIDVLGMLQKKTRGNLTRQEAQIIESFLADLRMQYVSLTSAPQKRPGAGFSAKDILGGK